MTANPKLSGLEKGIIAAAAFVADAHGLDGVAKDLLKQHGLTSCAGADEWDIERLLAAGVVDANAMVKP